MQDSLGNENSASAKKALAKVQKMLALVQLKRHALALRDYREVLDECLKPEASVAMKVLAFRMAARVPTCTTHEVWATLLDASVTELASSQNAAVLVHSIPLFEHFPMPLVLSFLAASEREPMNKLRAVLQHEQSDVRCVAIATFARVTLDAADAIATQDALFAFPFESHEARIVCQHDVWTIAVDVWKIVFQALQVDSAMPEVAGAAFVAMRMLFAKTSRMAPFDVLHPEPRVTQAAANDLAAAMYKEAAPRIRMLVASAQRLPTRFQVDAAWWLAMLLSMMMDRTGATCPSVSVPYLEIDVMKSAHAGGHGGGGRDDDDDDDESRPTTERVRMDQLTADVVTSWMQRLLGGRVALAPAASLCRALFIALSHPLQEFTRLQVARRLVEQLIAQCFFQKAVETRLEMAHLLLRAFAWTTSSDCVALFGRVTEAVHLMERDSDRRELRQQLLDTICTRVFIQRDLLLLESIAAMPIFRQSPPPTTRLSPRVGSSDLFAALVHALVAPSDDTAAPAQRQVAQLVVLKAFQPLLLAKGAATAPHDSLPLDLLSYISLLTHHYHTLVRRPDVAVPESLAFFEQDVQRAWPQISFCAVRIQLLWVAIQLHINRQLLPVSRLMELLRCEVNESYAILSDEERALKSQQKGGTTAGSLDDGRLGAGVDCDASSFGSSEWQEAQETSTVMVMMECLQSMAQLDPQLVPQLQEFQAAIRASIAAATSTTASSALSLILDEPLAPTKDAASSASWPRSLFAFRRFHPSSIFVPRSSGADAVTRDDEPPVRSREFTITGSADPIALRVSYRQPIAGHDDVIAVCVTACNTTNMALSDFEIQIRSQGPVRCIDPSNDCKIRLFSAGASSASTLAPFGTLKGEKRFLLQRFASATFFFHVAFQEVESSGAGEDGAQALSTRLAASNPFVVRADALMRVPAPQLATASFFQSAWQRAEDGVVFPIELPHDSKSKLSPAQRALHVRSTKRNMYELSKHPQETLLFTSATTSSDRVASSQVMSATLRTASRHVSASRRASFKSGPPTSAFAADPFAAPDFPVPDFPAAGATKWADGSQFDASPSVFGSEQLRPTAPTTSASSGFGSSDPWGF
ncbi:hypothetical protein ATCC90586_002648 [Pythium insidiosum]|nr:hypothetical protein ATCC90586_002648 [Pythium insidiosum]